MGGSNRGTTPEDVLRVFTEVDDPWEPLATSEIAKRVGCDHQTACDALELLAERGDVETKRIGARARAWWRRPPVTESERIRALKERSGASPRTQDRPLIERVLEVSPVSIVVVEASGEILFANKRAQEMLGLEHDEITDRTYRQRDWNVRYDDGTPVPVEEHPVTRVLETGVPEYGFEHWIEVPGGADRWLSSNSVPILNRDGGVDYVVVGFEDTTRLKKRRDELTSDDYRLLELHSEELFQRFLDTADGTISVDVNQVMKLRDGTSLQYLTASGISIRTLTDLFDSQTAVLDVRMLSSSEDTHQIEVHVDGVTLPVVFDAFGGRVMSLIQSGDENGPVLTGELPGDVDPRAVIDECRQVYPDLELKSQEVRYTPRLLSELAREVLTDRQFVALKAAYHGGYFETPKQSTGDELAVRLDITRQTFNQHLRKAEQSVFEQLFEGPGNEAH